MTYRVVYKVPGRGTYKYNYLEKELALVRMRSMNRTLYNLGDRNRAYIVKVLGATNTLQEKTT